MSTKEVFKHRNWTNSHLGEPYEIDGYFYLTVKTKYKGFSDQADLDRIKLEAREVALDHLLDFFNLKVTNPSDRVQVLLQVEAADWILKPRMGSKIRVLVRIEKALVFQIFQAKLRELTGEDILSMNLLQIEIPLPDIDKIARDITAKLRQFTQPAKKFVNKIPGFNINSEIRRIEAFPSKVRDLLRYNQIELTERLMRTGSAAKVIFKLTPGFQIEAGAFQGSDGSLHALHYGWSVFIENPAIKAASTIAFIFKYLSDAEDFLSDNRNYLQFLMAFLYPAVGIIPSRESIERNIKKTADDIIEEAGLKEEKDALSSIYGELSKRGILKAGTKLDIRKRREEDADFVADNIIFDYEAILPKMVSIEHIYSQVLARIEIGAMIDIAIDCIPNFDFHFPRFKFKLPTFKLPTLPVFDLLIFIRINLEDLILILVGKLLEFLISFILKIIIDFCVSGEGGGATNIPVRGPDLNGGVERIGKPPGTVYADYFPDKPGEDLTDFTDEVPKRLTPDQLCALLNGKPSSATIEIIMDLLEEVPYDRLKDVFKTEDDIINFFTYIAAILGAARVDDICASDDTPIDDICSADDAIRNIQRLIYDLKRERGENIPEEFIDEQLQKVEDIKKMVLSVIEMLGDGVLDSLKDEILEAIQNQKPFEGQNVKMASDALVDGVFSPISKEGGKMLSNFSKELERAFVETKKQDPSRNLLMELRADFSPLAVSNRTPEFRRLARILYDDSPFLLGSEVEVGYLADLKARLKQSESLILEFLGEGLKRGIKNSQRNVSIGDMGQGGTIERNILRGITKAYIRGSLVKRTLMTLPISSMFHGYERRNGFSLPFIANRPDEIQEIFQMSPGQFIQDVFNEDQAEIENFLRQILDANSFISEILTQEGIPEVEHQNYLQLLPQVANYSEGRIESTFSLNYPISTVFDSFFQMVDASLKGMFEALKEGK